MLFIQLFLIFSRGKLDSLEAPLRPVEQLDKRLAWTAEGRTMQEQLSRRRVWVHIIRDARVTTLKCLNHLPRYDLGTLRLNLHPWKLSYKISKIIGEHTCEGKSKDKSIGVAD